MRNHDEIPLETTSGNQYNNQVGPRRPPGPTVVDPKAPGQRNPSRRTFDRGRPCCRKTSAQEHERPAPV
ncbi:hypothetical protein PENSUB_7179 [Penicillium subrubescens]|uniref:Uncharacterized protein n=1 Tax=Penicillium subrubescens TaxID=1316194 RepID=A0A1Q5TQ99_9EURO|nr:hypothetical protein PENSUB_7179 [Penicillium subrubescens]